MSIKFIFNKDGTYKKIIEKKSPKNIVIKRKEELTVDANKLIEELNPNKKNLSKICIDGRFLPTSYGYGFCKIGENDYRRIDVREDKLSFSSKPLTKTQLANEISSNKISENEFYKYDLKPAIIKDDSFFNIFKKKKN